MMPSAGRSRYTPSICSNSCRWGLSCRISSMGIWIFFGSIRLRSKKIFAGMGHFPAEGSSRLDKCADGLKNNLLGRRHLQPSKWTLRSPRSMPKLQSRIQERPIAEGRPETFHQISFTGFIDAANYAAFERILDDVYQRGGRFAVADFSALNYINSTGISALIRLFGQFRERAGVFCLASVTKPVGLSMHLLGVTSLIPFLKDVDAARQNFLDVLEGRVLAPVGAEIGGEAVAPAGPSV